MKDIVITWKKITRGLPRARRFADDRAPTPDEILRIIEYPDRRIKQQIEGEYSLALKSRSSISVYQSMRLKYYGSYMEASTHDG
jgi:hypothetical protein